MTCCTPDCCFDVWGQKDIDSAALEITVTLLYNLLRGTVHQNQSDTPFLLGLSGRLLAGTSSKLDPATAMDINNALVLSFLHERLGEEGEG